MSALLQLVAQLLPLAAFIAVAGTTWSDGPILSVLMAFGAAFLGAIVGGLLSGWLSRPR